MQKASRNNLTRTVYAHSCGNHNKATADVLVTEVTVQKWIRWFLKWVTEYANLSIQYKCHMQLDEISNFVSFTCACERKKELKWKIRIERLRVETACEGCMLANLLGRFAGLSKTGPTLNANQHRRAVTFAVHVSFALLVASGLL